MRIVAGKYRGKKLKDFNIPTTKPTLDNVKEAMFNIIQFDVLGSDVLDLFAGTGALGIEAISRGANNVIFVDNNPKAINLIKQNLSTIQGNYQVIKSDYLTFLKQNNKFDIVLLDPPFATEFGFKAIDYLTSNNLINVGGIILFETAAQKDFTFNKTGYSCVRKTYGTVAVYKITREE